MGGMTVRFYTRRGAPELSDRDPETYPPEAVAVFDMSPACRGTARRSSCQLELARGTGRSRYHHRQTGGGKMETGARFLAAFNDIESHFRSVLGADDHAEFGEMARKYAGSRHLPRDSQDALLAFASLRNAISHGRYFGGRPIAEPVEEVVEQIERLRDRIKAPPTALRVVGTMDVRTAVLDQPINAALEQVRRFDYSQLPVYDDDGSYAGILTTNAIARWLAAQLTATGGLAETQSVRDVLAFAEQHERARHVPKTITAAEAIHELSSGGLAGRPAAALIITHSGSESEKPLAVVVSHDLPALLAALAIS